MVLLLHAGSWFMIANKPHEEQQAHDKIHTHLLLFHLNFSYGLSRLSLASLLRPTNSRLADPLAGICIVYYAKYVASTALSTSTEVLRSVDRLVAVALRLGSSAQNRISS